MNSSRSNETTDNPQLNHQITAQTDSPGGPNGSKHPHYLVWLCTCMFPSVAADLLWPSSSSSSKIHTHIPALCTHTHPSSSPQAVSSEAAFQGCEGIKGGLWVVTPTTNPKTSSLIRLAFWIFVVLQPISLFYWRNWLNVGLLDWLVDC